MGQGRRHFTDEFKQEAIALLVSSGRPLSQIASELGISPSMLRNWRDDERFRRRLAAAAKDWREGQGGLWGPTELELLRRWRERPGQAATPKQQDFIDASEAALRKQQQQALRATRLLRIAALVFAVLALVATGAGTLAWREERRAERSLDAAKTAVNVLVVDIAHGLRNVEGVRISLIRTVLERIQDTVEWLTRFAPDNLALWHLYLETLDEFATTYETAGDIGRARKSAMTALAKGESLPSATPMIRCGSVTSQSR